MNTNSRFAVTIHILTLLAYKKDELLTSEYIASSVTTNPVVIRRVLGDLRRAGLVTSQPGIKGGWKLKTQPSQITLLDAYCAVQKGCPFPLPPQKPNKECTVGKLIQTALTEVFTEAEEALRDKLSQMTIEVVLNRIQTEGACQEK